jgi:hypothetical protein
MILSAEETTPEEVYELLRGLERDGLLNFIVPTDPLGVEWVLGVEPSQMLKLNHEQVVAFLIGNQMTLQWLMAEVRKHGLPSLPL